MSVGSLDIITDGLVLYLDSGNDKSYSGSGTDLYDLTSNFNNGVLTNGPTFSPSNVGSIVFDGIDDFVDISNSTSLNPTQSITMCSWVEFNGTYTGYFAPFIFKQNNYISYYEQYVLAFLSTGEIEVVVGNSGYDELIVSPLSYTNQLINVVGIIDVVNQLLQLYINGELIQSSSITISSFDISTNSVRIGGNNTPGFPGYMGGNIYNVSIYDRVLTPQEILHNYNKLKWRFL